MPTVLTMASSRQEEQVELNLRLPTAIAQATANFCLDLYKDVASSVSNSDNVFFSPFSINVALAMLLAGARGNTALQVASVLHLPEDLIGIHAGFHQLLSDVKSNEKYSLETANRLYVRHGFKILESFQSLLEQHYRVTAESLDFTDEPKSRKAINDWVAETTNQIIKDIITPGILNGLTRLVLVNAVIFKADWLMPFDRENTSDQPFYMSATTSTQISMMRLEEYFNYGHLQDLKTRILELPYNDPRLGMLIFLPDEVEGIKQLEENVRDLPLLDLDSLLRNTKVIVVLPKFKVELSLSLNDHLKNLGIMDLFDELKVDLSGFTGQNNLAVSNVIHKAFVEVNEEGTKAAAAGALYRCKGDVLVDKILFSAAMIMVDFSVTLRRTPRFVADHPFLFMIRDSVTKTVLFAGRLAAP